jgi:hypothetical protein
MGAQQLLVVGDELAREHAARLRGAPVLERDDRARHPNRAAAKVRLQRRERLAALEDRSALLAQRYELTKITEHTVVAAFHRPHSRVVLLGERFHLVDVELPRKRQRQHIRRGQCIDIPCSHAPQSQQKPIHCFDCAVREMAHGSGAKGP